MQRVYSWLLLLALATGLSARAAAAPGNQRTDGKPAISLCMTSCAGCAHVMGKGARRCRCSCRDGGPRQQQQRRRPCSRPGCLFQQPTYLALCCVAIILKAWRNGFACADSIRRRLYRGPGAWVGSTPCDSQWWGVGCSVLGGVKRVTSM
jgi:hypothetical protein